MRGATSGEPIPPLTEEDIARFIRLLNPGDDLNACWDRGKKQSWNFTIEGKTYPASRIAYTIHKGEIPPRMCVCHTCDNPPCCNPTHLFLGSQSGNMLDAFSKGRVYFPGNHPHYY